MQCNRCGQQNRDNAFACSRCGMVLQQKNSNTRPNNLTHDYNNQMLNQVNPVYNQVNSVQYANNSDATASANNNVQEQWQNMQQLNNKKKPNKVVIIIALIIIVLLMTCCIGGVIVTKVVGNNKSDTMEYTEDNSINDIIESLDTDVISDSNNISNDANQGVVEDTINEAMDYTDDTLDIENTQTDNISDSYIISDDNISEENKPEVNNDKTDEIISNNTEIKYGSDTTGYLQLNGKWVEFKDVDITDESRGNILQYTDGNNIVTLNSAYMGDPDATILNISNYMRETENVTTNTFDLDNMHASEMYTVDNVGYRMYLVCFTSDLTDDMIYLSVESPVSSLE